MDKVTIKLCQEPEDLRLCRETAENSARNMGFTGDDLGDIVCAVFEACVNAFTYGRANPDDPIILTIYSYPNRLEAVVKDSGGGFCFSNAAPIPSFTSPRGRGIPLMRAFMDEVRFEIDGGCKVTLVKHLRSND